MSKNIRQSLVESIGPPCFNPAATVTLRDEMEDRYGHRISYLRVSITDRCNERCTYCMPHELQEWLAREDVLTYEETLRLVGIAAGLGVSKIKGKRGGPLTRRGVLGFVQRPPSVSGGRGIG